VLENTGTGPAGDMTKVFGSGSPGTQPEIGTTWLGLVGPGVNNSPDDSIFNGAPVNVAQAHAWIAQANALIVQAEALAAST
jgi:hypothetical protein